MESEAATQEASHDRPQPSLHTDTKAGAQQTFRTAPIMASQKTFEAPVRILLAEILAVLFIGAGALFQPLLFIPGILYCISAPALMAHTRSLRQRLTFVNILTLGFFLLLDMVHSIVMNHMGLVYGDTALLCGFILCSVCLLVACAVAGNVDRRDRKNNRKEVFGEKG